VAPATSQLRLRCIGWRRGCWLRRGHNNYATHQDGSAETRTQIRTLIRIKTGRGVADCGEYCQAAGTIAQHLWTQESTLQESTMRPAGGLLPQHSEMKSRASDQATDARMRRSGARQKTQVIVDLSVITCGQYMGKDRDTQDVLAAWMSGYFNAAKNQSMVDLSRFERNRKAVEKYCRTHKLETLMSAIQRNAY
jgi:acid stress chaperone HdeB